MSSERAAYGKRWEPSRYAEGVRAGDRTALSRSITLVESTLPADRGLADKLLRLIQPHTGQSIRLGITGVPGVGKSTFIDAFGTHLTGLGHKVAVLAIDPSSELSGGSILGDKTRMERLSRDPNAFIRPTPTGGSLGGVSRKTRESMLLCEAAGYDVIIVETVGVGQSETAVRAMTDFFLLLMLAGAGDELQGIKKGVMEMADGIAINKADGDNLQPARLARAEYQSAVRMFATGPDGWRAPVSLCSALESQGMDEIWTMVLRFREETKSNGYWWQRRKEQAVQWMEEALRQEIESRFFAQEAVKLAMEELRSMVEKGEMPPTVAARQLADLYFSGDSEE